NPMNDEKLMLQLNPAARQSIPQIAPGRYQIDLPAPRTPATASILREDQLLDRFAVAGRYPREFDAIGNDIDALRALADRSGGRVISPSEHGPVEIPDTRTVVSLASLFSILGFALIGGALIN